MGVDSRRPPLPAPTESMDENDTSGGDTELATNVTTRTDKSHYTIPEDGRPITISTQKITSGDKEGGIGRHGRQKSQTSLLIEYFEASKTGDKSRSRPSVRVKVTPSSAKKGRSGSDSVQITSISKDRKASYTRRIPLPSSKQAEGGRATTEGSELSTSSGSNVSGHPPVEIEVMNSSDISRPDRSSRGLMYAPAELNISPMPPDSMLEGENSLLDSELSYDDATPVKETAYLRTPQRTGSQSRTNSRDRITQKVMEKLGASGTRPRKSSRSSQEQGSKEDDYEAQTRERRRRSSKSQRSEDDAVTGAESSLLSYRSDRSYRSVTSQARSMTNNPKLLEMVEDTIKRMILPEINQMKEEQKIDRKLHKYDDSRWGPRPESSTSLQRKLSKSSSTPYLASKPKVVLNRDGDDPGVVLSRGDSERVKHRKSSREHSERHSSSRRSSGRHSREGSYETEEKLHKKSSRSTNGLRGAAAAGIVAGVAGGALSSAALKHHDSQSDLIERRKRRAKSRSSRSRSASINESVDEVYLQKEKVPAMPMASAINDSEVTRESILSQGTDRPSSRASGDVRTPIREVSRGSVGDAMSPASSRTPTRPTSRQDRNIGMSHTNLPLQSPSLDSPMESPSGVKSPNGGMSNKARLAALAAAGLGGTAVAKGLDSRHVDTDGYGDAAPQRKISNGSPVQSVSSLRRTFEDEPLIPRGLRPRSAASRSPAGLLRESQRSESSLRSAPTTQRLAQSAKQSRDVSVDEFETPAQRPDAAFSREDTGTPGAETADEWLERQHLINDQYRDSMTTNRDSYQSNPYPEDSQRFTMYTDDSYLDHHSDAGAEQGVREINGGGLAPNYVHTPVGVESAVASLMDPSTVSSHVLSSTSSPRKSNGGTYSDRMAAQLHDVGNEKSPLYNGSTLSEGVQSQDRWAAIKGHARNLSEQSPAQSPFRDARKQPSDEKPVMTASGLPLAEDPLPEIGHYDSQSDLQTNPSIIQGPLGGDVTGKSTWPYTPEPESNRNSAEQEDFGKGAGLAAAAAGGAAALAATHASRQSKAEDQHDVDADCDATPTGRSFRDEGYATDGRTRSGGGVTPKAEMYSKQDLDEYHRAMNAQGLGDEDPFSSAAKDPRHMRHVSGNSHGMDSPLYDASTGKGMDRIESKDIVALMDHLTVRDAQRNARDTEILVTLVRSAAEMRSSFDEMKKFIAEQDKLIMQNTDRDAELTAQKVLGGPRPQPMPSPRTPRRQVNSEEDIQTKRKGVLSRALKGLTGGRSAKDLARVEDMLMQILDNVEDLKYQQTHNAPLDRSYTMDSLDTYENMRATQDSGYEPEGQAGTSSTASHSDHFPTTPREKQQFHSGYDGRRGSDNRVSTVLEESDGELEPHEAHVLNHQFENNERMLTPTQERQRDLGPSPRDTPPQPSAAANNDQTPEKQRKHKSSSSSLFGISVPKISRWSRTTASSAAPEPATLDSPKQTQEPKKSFDSSRSSLEEYDDDSLRSKDTLPRKQNPPGQYAESRSMRSQASSRLTRTPSPLIPSETSAKQRASYDYDRAGSPVQEDEEARFDDPKYQAHRNSLLLEHPQPRQGPTSRHQNTLESQAHSFDDPAGTNSDLSQQTVSDFDPSAWGSSGTAGLARHRLTQVEPMSPVSMNSHEQHGNGRGTGDSDPLVPQQKPAVPPKIKHEDSDEWEEPQYSNSGFSRGGYYSSPYGSGHLLEPIEEVRYSLETDSGRNMSPDPQVASAKAVNLNSPARKGGLTGPRPMGSSRTPSYSNKAMVVDSTAGAGAGTVRRKPVPGAQGTNSVESLYSRFAM